MPSSPILLIHICAAAVALISGGLAMAFRKGAGLHRIAGNVFFISMLLMSGAGVYMAVFTKPNNGNVMGGALAFYLVATGWMAAKRRDLEVGSFDVGALLVALVIGVADLTWGFEAARSQSGLKQGYPAGLYFIFGSLTLLFAASDVRMLVRGGVAGAQRIARHLWRMGFALFIAVGSFYPGQAKLFSASLRKTNLLYVPLVLTIGLTLFWMCRVSLSNAYRSRRSVPARRPDVELRAAMAGGRVIQRSPREA